MRKVASTSGGAVCVGMPPDLALGVVAEKDLARAKDWGVGACGAIS